MNTDPLVSRRMLLRGMGTAMALPFLEAMASAQTGKKASDAPVRMAFLFVPNGINMKHWTPDTEGALGELPSTLEPLAGLKDHFNVLTGLSQYGAEAQKDGAGDHARSAAAWLTGCHPRKTDGANIQAGISADQLAALKRGHQTLFPSLELGCERGSMAGNCDSGYSCAYSHTISWRSDTTPVAKEDSPRLVFERLFKVDNLSESAAARAKRQRYNQSVLDFIKDDATRLQKKLGAHDKQKLDEYFTGIREIERRIAFLEKASKATGATAENFQQRFPANNKGALDYPEQIQLLGDMMVLAFQADITRISTFMLADEGSGRAYRNIGINEGHHDLSHHGRDAAKLEKLRKINHYHVEQLAYILNKMQSIKEGDKTLLDNTMLVYGGGISDGDRHNHNDLPLLLCGGGGGTIKSGRHVRYADKTPMSNLLITMLDRFGIPGETLGDSTGKLSQLF
ncbi:DUF1552 domain-containing protein [Armatimonas sp.]|uniref:DUF1552 domain-containing protein n=1 Tax=Armatimonas sp. TaxID=1872638 RepID=UPI00374C8FED